MKTLLLDSAGMSLSVGIAVDGKLVRAVSYPCWQRQSEKMIPEIESALKETGLCLKDFDEFVSGKGPGSYTGIRIALTIAKIAAQMAKAKLIPISSLRIMGDRNKRFIALMNARSGRSYIGVYAYDEVILEDCVMKNEEVLRYVREHPEFTVIGDCGYLGISSEKPDEIRGLLSFREIVSPLANPAEARPVYLKDHDGI